MMERPTHTLKDSLERYTDSIACPECSGFSEKVDVTPAEIEEHQRCGRSYACCIAAFECKLCKLRIIAQLESPEMFDD